MTNKFLIDEPRRFRKAASSESYAGIDNCGVPLTGAPVCRDRFNRKHDNVSACQQHRSTSHCAFVTRTPASFLPVATAPLLLSCR